MKQQVKECTAVWTQDGRISPRQFSWQGQELSVTSVGRDWRDAEGYHVLCMTVLGVMELILNPQNEWSASATQTYHAA